MNIYTEYKKLAHGMTSDQFLARLDDFAYCESVGRWTAMCEKNVLPKHNVGVEPPKGACQMRNYRLVNLRKDGGVFCEVLATCIAYPCQIQLGMQKHAVADGCRWVADI